MATQAPISVDDTAYVSLSSLANALVTNNSSYPIYVAHAAAQPAASFVGHSLDSGESYQKITGNPSDQIWAICQYANRTSLVTVSDNA